MRAVAARVDLEVVNDLVCIVHGRAVLWFTDELIRRRLTSMAFSDESVKATACMYVSMHTVAHCSIR